MTEFAAATEDDRPVLKGCKVESGEETLTMVGADGFRLAVKSVPVVAGETADCIIPATTLRLLRSLLSVKGNTAELVWYRADGDRKQMTVYSDTYLPGLTDLRITGQTIAGTFPNYQPLIPTTHTAVARMLRSDLLSAVKEMAPIAAKGSGIVRMQLLADVEGADVEGAREAGAWLSTRAEEVGEYEQRVPVKMKDDVPGKIAFNLSYMLDLLNVLPGDVVVLGITEPSSPGVWWDGDDDTYTHVIMPTFVQW